MIWLANEKTDTIVVIPLHRFIKAILKKHKGLPPAVSSGEMNRSLKEIGELCKINSPVLYTLTKGGVRTDYHLLKYEMISNHTARRSFITNLLKAGVSQIEVKKLSGVKKLATIERYFKKPELEVAERLKSHKCWK